MRHGLFWLLGLLLSAGAPAWGAATLPSPGVRLLVSEPLPYRGQELVLTLEFRYRSRPHGALQVVWPGLDPFSVDELPAPPPRRLAPPGQPAEIVESQLLLLRPLVVGTINLRGAGVRLADGTLLPAPPLALRVRPLPAAGRPPNFGGGVGGVELRLDAAGSGRREITVLLTGNAWLEGFPAPRLDLPRGGRLIPLGEVREGRPGQDRSRRWRYLYDPGAVPNALPAVTLTSFDPGSGHYRRLQAGARANPVPLAGWGVLLALAVLAGLAGQGWRRRRRTPDTLLHRFLGRPPRGLTEAALTQLLVNRGAASETVELWRRWRRNEELRAFAPVPAGADAEGPKLRSRLVRALAKEIDKRRGFPYLQRVRMPDFPTDEVNR